MKKKIAYILLRTNAVKIEPDKPFRFSSGIMSPIYCDNRLLLSDTENREAIIKGFIEELKNIKYDVIVGVATSGIPWASMLADRLEKPLVYVRQKTKEYGRKNAIEGKLETGKKVVVIEDLISTGGSSLHVVERLKESGVEVVACIAIFTYGMKKSEDGFKKENCALRTLCDFETLINVATENNFCSESEKIKVLSWNKNPEKWKI